MKTIKINGCKFKQQEIEIISSHVRKVNERIEKEVLNNLTDDNITAYAFKVMEIQKEEEDKLTEREKQVINNYTECLDKNKEGPTKRYLFTAAISLFVLISGANPAVPAIALLIELMVILVLCLLNVKSSVNFSNTIKLIKMVNGND